MLVKFARQVSGACLVVFIPDFVFMIKSKKQALKIISIVVVCPQEPVKGLPSLAPKKKKADSEAGSDKQATAAE